MVTGSWRLKILYRVYFVFILYSAFNTIIRVVAEAFADIGARSFFADCVQFMLAQHAFDIMVALAAARFHADPIGFAQALFKLDYFDGVARSLAGAGLFFSCAHAYILLSLCADVAV